jgi:hypothetical protein
VTLRDAVLRSAIGRQGARSVGAFRTSGKARIGQIYLVTVIALLAVLCTLAGLRPRTYGAAVTEKPRAERGHWVRSEAVEPRERGHYVPDGTVHAVDDQTGEVACGFDGELIEVEAAWDSPAVASLKCADCEQVRAS